MQKNEPMCDPSTEKHTGSFCCSYFENRLLVNAL